jgi:hypothetical protein
LPGTEISGLVDEVLEIMLETFRETLVRVERESVPESGFCASAGIGTTTATRSDILNMFRIELLTFPGDVKRMVCAL